MVFPSAKELPIYSNYPSASISHKKQGVSMSAFKCLDCGQYVGRRFFFFTSDREGRCLPCYNRIKAKVDQHDATIQESSLRINEHNGKLEVLEGQVQATNETVQKHHDDIEVIQRDLPQLQHQVQATNETVQKHHDDIEVIQRDLPQLQHQVQATNETAQKNHEDIEEIQREIPQLKHQGQATVDTVRMQGEEMEIMQQQMKVLQQKVQQLDLELKLQRDQQEDKAAQVKIETLRLKQEQSKERQKQKDLEQEQEKTKQKACKERTARLKNERTIKQGENLTKLSEFANKIEGLPEQTTIALLNYGQILVDEDGPLTIGDENLTDSFLPGRSVPDTNYGIMDHVDDYTELPDAYNSNWTRYHGKPKTAKF